MTQAKPRRVSQPSDIDAKILELKQKREKMLEQRGRRYARIADQAGLLEIQIGDDDLLKAFKEMAQRFRARGAKTLEPVASAEPAPEPADAAQ